jgi:hypothetical protein
VTQYHVTLNSQGYVLDLERYQKRPRAPFVSKSAQGTVSFQDLRGPEQVLRLTDWSGGEGRVQHDVSAPSLYRTGSGLDVSSTPGGVQLGPYAVQLAATSESSLGPMCVYGSHIYVASASGNVYRYDGTTWSALGVWAVSGITCMEVYLSRLYFGQAGSAALGVWNGSTTAVAATAAGPIYTLRTHYRQAAQYLYLGVAGAGVNGIGRIYYWDGGSISPGQYDPEEGTPLVSFVLGGRCYFCAADLSAQRWTLYSVDDATAGGIWRVHDRVIGGGYPLSAVVVNGVAYLGDVVAGRIWSWDGSRLQVVHELSAVGATYGGQIRGMVAWRGALWVGIQQGGGIGLLRYAPSTSPGQASASSLDSSGRQAAWSRPVTGLTGTDVYGLGVFSDQLVVGGSQSGASRSYSVRPAQFQATGQLESGLIDAGLPGTSKLLRSVTIVTSALVSPQTVQVEYRLEDTGGWTSLGTLASVGATTATYAFAANTTGRQVAFRITLSGTAGASSSPVLYELTLRYVPRPTVTREWELAVLLEGTAELPLVTLDGAAEPLTGAQLATALWTAAGQAGPVPFVDLDGTSYQVYVDDLHEEAGKISQRRGYQRLGLVKLVEAA